MAITKFLGVTNTIQSLSDRPNQNEGLTPAQLKQKFDQFAIDNKAYLNEVLSVEIDTLDSKNIKDTGTQTIAGVKTFTSSPIVPTPTTDTQASNKKYVDDVASGVNSGLQAQIDTNVGDISTLQNRSTTSENNIVALGNTKTDKTGNHLGSWQGISSPSASEPGIQGVVDLHTSQLADMMTLTINPSNPGHGLAPIKTDGTDTSTELQAILDYAGANGISTVWLPKCDIGVSKTLSIPEWVHFRGSGKTQTIIRALTSGMTVIACNSSGFHISEMLINGYLKTGTAIYINEANSLSGVSQNWIIERLRIQNCEYMVKTYYAWVGVIRDIIGNGNKKGIYFLSQSNAITVSNCTVQTSTGDNFRFTNAFVIDIRCCNITQITASGDTHGSAIVCTNGIGEINFEGNYFEGLFEDKPIIVFSSTASLYAYHNFKFNNNGVSGLTNPLYVADLYNIYNCEFKNNNIDYIGADAFKFNSLYPSKNIIVEANNNKNWGFEKQIQKNIVANSNLTSWNGGDITYPSAWAKSGTGVITLEKDTDGSFKWSIDTSNGGVYVNLQPEFLYFPTLKFSAKSSLAGYIVVSIVTVLEGVTATESVNINLTTEYQDFELIFPLLSASKGYANILKFVSSTTGGTTNSIINLKNVILIPSLSNKISEEQYSSYNMPTLGYWRKSQYVKNLNKTILGTTPNQYYIKGWERLTNSNANVLNTDWLEDRALTGQ